MEPKARQYQSIARLKNHFIHEGGIVLWEFAQVQPCVPIARMRFFAQMKVCTLSGIRQQVSSLSFHHDYCITVLVKVQDRSIAGHGKLAIERLILLMK